MAGQGYKLFTTGSVLTAAEVNTYLQEQTVMVFADATARTTALSGVLAEGMFTYLKDTDVLQYYSGASWVTVNTDQTPLTTKGDLFTYSTADARLAVGSNGDTLLADSSATTGLRWQNPKTVNYLLNSAMDIWQRGTSFTSLNNGITYLSDRWFQFVGAAVTQAQASRSTDVPTGFTYSLKYGRPNATTNEAQQYIAQILESAASVPLANKTVALSFWAKKGANYSGASDALLVKLSSGTGTDQSAATFSGGPATGFTGNTLVVNSTATLTTSWQRFTFSGSVASTATQIGLAIGYDPVGTAGADDNFYVTGVQLEIGTVATPFQTSTGTLAGELAACQRYYYLVASGNTLPLGAAWTDATTQGQIMIPFPVTMRTSPAIVQTTGTNYYNINTANSGKLFNSFTGINIASTTMATIYGTISGATAGQGGYAYTSNASASIAMSSEL